MRKFLIIAFTLIGITTLAQPIEQSKLTDNVSITIKGGVTTPLNTPVEDFKPVLGLELEKMITPVFGVGIEGEWTVNTSKWTNQVSDYWFDHQYVGVFTTTNWMNLLGGYKGESRFFEIESVIGVGWGHAYTNGEDPNYVMTKAGLNINFNINEALSISAKPAVVWNMNESSEQSNYSINRAALQFQVGLTYHFSGPSGERNFILCNKVATQSEIDALNRQINALREQNQRTQDWANSQIAELNSINAELAKTIRTLTNKEPEVVVVLPPIQFEKGSSEISETSKASLSVIAEAIKSVEGNYSIVGYASEEGDEDYNKELSMARAESVKSALVELGVNPNQLSVFGAGETTKFSELPELNRIVIFK